MSLITKSYIKANEARRKWSQGQTMTEYALIMAAIAGCSVRGLPDHGSGHRDVGELGEQFTDRGGFIKRSRDQLKMRTEWRRGRRAWPLFSRSDNLVTRGAARWRT